MKNKNPSIKSNDNARKNISDYRTGIQSAFATLMKQYSPAMTVANKKYFPYGDTARIQTQNQWVRISEIILKPGFKEILKFDTWSRKICINMNKDTKRKEKTEKLNFVDDIMLYQTIDEDENTQYAEQMELLKEPIKKLSIREKLIFDLTTKNRTPKAIAKILNQAKAMFAKFSI